MEILTPQILWKGYDASVLPLSASVLSDKTQNGRRVIHAYFNGTTTTDGVARVYVRCVLPADGKPAPVVVYLPDVHQAADKADVDWFTARGYAVVIPDYVGERTDDPHYTLYPRSMEYANFTPDCLSEVPGDMRFNCWIVWAETAMRAVTFAASLDGVDPERIALFGTGVSTASVIKAAAIDRRLKCAVTMFSSGQAPEDSEGQEYLKYKVALTDGAYAPMIKVPLLMMLASNEQDGSLDEMSDVFSLIPPESGSRLSISERTSHIVGVKQRDNLETWLGCHLLGRGEIPQSPVLSISCSDHALYYNVKAPAGCGDVELFTSQAMPFGALRNWSRAKLTESAENEYVARIDVYDPKKPVYAFVNACGSEGGMSVSTPVIAKIPALLGVAETPVKGSRLVYDGDMGTDDWLVLSPLAGKDSLFMMKGPFGIEGVTSTVGTISTFKLGDAMYRGSGTLLLQIMIYSAGEQDVTFTVTARDKSGDEEKAGYADYSHTERLSPADNWRKITFEPSDFKSPFAVCGDWERVVYLRIDSDSPVAVSSMIWV